MSLIRGRGRRRRAPALCDPARNEGMGMRPALVLEDMNAFGPGWAPLDPDQQNRCSPEKSIVAEHVWTPGFKCLLCSASAR